MAIKPATTHDSNCKTGVQKRERNQRRLDAVLDAGPLASFICHDLRHPLTAILAYSELLAEDDLGGRERKDFHREIRLAVNRMNDLISLLLESSKGSKNFRPEVANITETVRRAIQAVTIRPEFHRIRICYGHEGAAEGRFDPRRLQQVITNVVLNACEAVPPGCGRIEVISVGHHDYAEITISDNGPGIPEPIRHAVFQPFVTYGKAGGTGLGLAIVQQILRARGGEIYLDATGKEGTRFRVVLPYVGPHRDVTFTESRTRGEGIIHPG